MIIEIKKLFFLISNKVKITMCMVNSLFKKEDFFFLANSLNRTCMKDKLSKSDVKLRDNDIIQTKSCF